MSIANLEPLIEGKPRPFLTNSYDESSRRIRKRYDYYYQTECGGIEPLGGMITMGGIPIGGEDTCIEWTCSEQHYLYDRGLLLAVFDRYDNVEQFYVNGPGGQVAVYDNNNDDNLYYFLKDHLGSTRAMIDKDNEVVQFVNYQPYGEILESWSSYDEPLKFTSKERDKYSSFDYYYFGSRYYDQRIGQFASIDKAGQFAGGYLYGGANPLIGIDPDGNSFEWLKSAYTWIRNQIKESKIYISLQGIPIGSFNEIPSLESNNSGKTQHGAFQDLKSAYEVARTIHDINNNHPNLADPDLFALQQGFNWFTGFGPEKITVKNAPQFEMALQETPFWNIMTSRIEEHINKYDNGSVIPDLDLLQRNNFEFGLDELQSSPGLFNQIIGSWSEVGVYGILCKRPVHVFSILPSKTMQK